MIRIRGAVHPLAAVVLCLAASAGLDLAAQDHVGQYAQSDIVRGSQAYAAQCATCHGPNGNNIGTVNLAQGRFRLATSDDDLKRLIQTGIPGAGMPPISLDSGDLTAIVAYIRSGLDVNARAGTLLWRTNLGGQIVSGPMSYQVNGKQHVSVIAGLSLVTFALRDEGEPGRPRSARDPLDPGDPIETRVEAQDALDALRGHRGDVNGIARR